MKQTISLLLLVATLAFATGCVMPPKTLPTMRNEIPIASPDLSLKPPNESYTKLIIFNTSSKLLYGRDRNDLVKIYLNGKGVTQLYMDQYVQVIVPRGKYKVDLVHWDLLDFSSSHTIELDTPEAYLNIRATAFSNSAKLVSTLPDSFVKNFVPVSGEQVIAVAAPPTPTPQPTGHRPTTEATMMPPQMSTISTEPAPKTEMAPADNIVDTTLKPAENDVLDSFASAPPLQPTRGWAVVIGISQYQYTHSGLSSLPFADDDARAFAAALRDLGWSSNHIKCLIDNQATERNIRIALESWLTKSRGDELIVLYWAGHGFSDPEDPEKVYFACYDTDSRIPATGFRMDRVVRILKERKAKNVVVLADTCHAGKLITRGGRGLSVVPRIQKMQEQKEIPKGWVFMVSAATDRKAVEHSSWRNGAFTHCLLKGLQGKADGFQSVGEQDGIVNLRELRSYLMTAMPTETLRVLGVAFHPLVTTSTGDPSIWQLTLHGQR